MFLFFSGYFEKVEAIFYFPAKVPTKSNFLLENTFKIENQSIFIAPKGDNIQTEK